MKTKIYLLAVAFLTANLAAAQVLYSEDFDNLVIGDLGTDITGQTPGQGGWYTYSHINGSPFPGFSNTDYQIAAEAGRGNVLAIDPPGGSGIHCSAFREDLKSDWQRRRAGSDILKLSIDIYTGGLQSSHNAVVLRNEKKEILTSVMFHTGRVSNGPKSFILGFPSVRYTGLWTIPNAFSQRIHLSSVSEGIWITLEMYIDYANSRVYCSIPSSYTVGGSTLFPLSLTGNEGNDDAPHTLELISYHWNFNIKGGTRFDNINISAVSTAPTVSVDAFVSEKFNIYPNPAEDMVTISNSENIGIEELTVYDITGKNVKSQNYSNTKEMTLDTAGFALGVYLLHIKTKEGTVVKKLIKK